MVTDQLNELSHQERVIIAALDPEERVSTIGVRAKLRGSGLYLPTEDEIEAVLHRLAARGLCRRSGVGWVAT